VGLPGAALVELGIRDIAAVRETVEALVVPIVGPRRFGVELAATLPERPEHDVRDVEALVDAGLVLRGRLLEAFDEIEPGLYHLPAIDSRSSRDRVAEATR
jgi:hypothetical protein